MSLNRSFLLSFFWRQFILYAMVLSVMLKQNSSGTWTLDWTEIISYFFCWKEVKVAFFYVDKRIRAGTAYFWLLFSRSINWKRWQIAFAGQVLISNNPAISSFFSAKSSPDWPCCRFVRVKKVLIITPSFLVGELVMEKNHSSFGDFSLFQVELCSQQQAHFCLKRCNYIAAQC